MLEEFYQTHNPAKLTEIDKVLEMYAGKEEQLFLNLAKKYNDKNAFPGKVDGPKIQKGDCRTFMMKGCHVAGVPIHDKGKDFEGMTAILQEAYVAFARTGDPSTAAAPFVPFDAAAPKMTVLDSPLSGGGCKVVAAMSAKDKAYHALVAAIRAAEQ